MYVQYVCVCVCPLRTKIVRSTQFPFKLYVCMYVCMYTCIYIYILYIYIYVCVYVCMYVRHAQKIVKLFFGVRSTHFPFKLNILFKKKYSNLLGPKILRRNFPPILQPAELAKCAGEQVQLGRRDGQSEGRGLHRQRYYLGDRVRPKRCCCCSGRCVW